MATIGPRLRLADLVESYLDRQRSRLAETTYRTTRSNLNRLALWWDGQPNRRVPKSMTDDDISDYLWGRHTCSAACVGRSHKGQGLRESLAPASFNAALGSIRRFMEYAHRHGEVKTEVVEAVDADNSVRVSRKRRRRLSVDQLVELVEGATDPWERILCALCVGTLGRSSELLTLRVSDVDLDDGLIRWNRHKVNDDSDALPITSELAHELESWFKVYETECGPLRPSWYLLPSRAPVPVDGGGHLWKYRPTWQCHGNLYGLVKPHLARALSVPVSDLKGEGVHTLRRSMARALYERLRAEKQGDPIGVVQALLGHSQRGMTERYIGVESGREARDSILRGRSMFGG